MPHNRYYIDHPLNLFDNVSFEEAEFNHMVKVMRVSVNEEIEIINGNGVLAKALIYSIEKKSVHATIQEIQKESKPKKSFIIAQALLKGASLDLICEKNAELGCDEIWLYTASLSEKDSISDNQIDRLNKVLIAATKQCGRLYLPKIVIFKNLKELIHFSKMPLFYGDVDPTSPKIKDAIEKESSLVFIIGPEKGFDKKEEELLKSSLAKGVSLHPNILRAETASIAASCLISNSFL